MTPMPIDCKSSLELLPLHVGGDLDPSEAAPLIFHLAQCEACRAEEAAAQTARDLFFQVAGGDGSEAVDLWPGVSLALAGERAQESSAQPVGAHSGWKVGERPLQGVGQLSPRSLPLTASALTGEPRLGVGPAEGRTGADGRTSALRRPGAESSRARRYSLAAAALTLVGSTVFFAALFEAAPSSELASNPAPNRPLVGSTMEGVTPVAEGQLGAAARNSSGTVPWGLSSPPAAELGEANHPGTELFASDHFGIESAPRSTGRLQPIRAEQRLQVDSIWVPLRRADGGQGNLANDG